MKILIAPDSFKESMTAGQACNAIEKGIKLAIPYAICTKVPLADGGEGTMQTLVDAMGGTIYKEQVTSPLAEQVIGEYAILSDGITAVVEIASASGLVLIPHASRNPLQATSYGTGQLIKASLKHRVSKLIIGLGGSATNDGGIGMMQALGVKFLNMEGKEIGPGNISLSEIQKIDSSSLIANYHPLTVEIISDVTNPLLGENGASAVFGPQKGATKDMVAVLDNNLKYLAIKLLEHTGKDVKDVPGAGAAGGSAAALLAFFNAKLMSGIQTIIRETGLEEKIKNTDYIFTGEGSIDKQTLYGKTLSGILALSKKYKKPVVAFAGKISDTEELYLEGFTSVIGILPSVTSLEEAIKDGERNLQNSANAVSRLLNTVIAQKDHV